MTTATSAAATPPFSFFEWMVARRYLAATRKGTGVSLISVIAFFGIMLAVATLIIVMSVMQGFRSQLLGQLLGVTGHFFVQSADPIEDYEAMAERLLAVPGVTSATPLIQQPVFARGQGEGFLIMRAIPKADLMKISYVTGPQHVKAGSFETFGVGRNGGDEIAIGSRVAWTLGVGPGDPVTLISGSGAETPFGPTLRQKTYRVGAIFEVGNSEYDAGFGFMPIEQAQLFFNFDDSVQQIEVRVEIPDRVQQYRPGIMQAAGGLEVRDWQQIHRAYFNALQTERSVMRIILLLIVAVAALNIITGLVMLVKDKTGDIAVLRTMGATQGSVMRIFFLSGSMIGVLGTLAGVALGALFVWQIDAIEQTLSWIAGRRLFDADIYYFSSIPAEMQLGEVTLIVAWSLFMSFITTIYPAWRAARLDPVEALRYE